MSGCGDKNWTRRVTESSDALDLEHGVFTWDDPRKIARSLKQSADVSRRRKGTPFQSAMSMLTFYVNRAGSHLTAERRQILEFRYHDALKSEQGVRDAATANG
jgi:hypothetical protein